MNPIATLKRYLATLVKRRGYHLERAVDYGPFCLDPLDLILRSLSHRDDVFVLQVGANNGASGDPLFSYLINKRWRGLLVEPQPVAFAQLQQTYAGCAQLSLEHCAVSDAVGFQTLYTVEGFSQLASFKRDVILRRSHKTFDVTEITVRTETFLSLAEKHSVEAVDVLVMDTEGFDAVLLRQYLESGLSLPFVVRYEHLHLSNEERSWCVDSLASKGYRFIRDGRDTIAVRAY